MKKAIFVFVALLAISATKSFAQKAGAGPELSIGLDGGLPLGDFKQGWKFGIGGTAKFAYNFDESVAATLTSGFISFSGKTIGGQKVPALKTIPIKAGVRYTFPGGFYGEPQLGVTRSSASGGGSSTGFTYAINAGYHTLPGIDVALRYEGISDNGTNSFIGLRIAYAFSLSSK